MNPVVYWSRQPQSISASARRLLQRTIILFLLSTPVLAQTETVTIELVPASAMVRIESVSEPRSYWSFRDAYAGVVGLGGRIRNLEVFDAQGARLNTRALAPGQFESSAPATRFRYEVAVNPPARAADAAFVSWITNERGLLMLGDLLPVKDQASHASSKQVQIELRVKLPFGWRRFSSNEMNARDEFEVNNADQTVIAVGKDLRSSSRAIANKPFRLVTDESWAFSDADALETAAKVIQVHSEVAGALPCGHVNLLLLPFAGAANQWTAETRGCTVTLLLGKLPSKTAALAQLGNALTHELFHLWIPNGVVLTGDYDWFYEGFTMYQAARSAVRLGLVTFPEFLNAIGRAYDAASARSDAQRLSLIEASRQRWTVGASSVYSKAMVVAFLYDLHVRSQSKGKRSLDDAYRKLLHEHLRKVNAKEIASDGNSSVAAILRSEEAAPGFVERFIAAPVTIDLQRELAPFGLRVEKLAVRTHISVNDNLTGRQRDLLRQLGYNEPRARKK